jgi:pSer/pThr/pTyr-binding forkhead associated (FHA) protein
MNTPHENGRAVYPRGAFLIIDGDEHFLLDRPVINIGRRKDNQLVLDKPEISRTHAQIRVRQGRFVLFDLGSKSGTQVNDIAIRQHIMQPGDVITICGIHLVYGEETAPKSDQTLGFSPGPLTSSGH